MNIFRFTWKCTLPLAGLLVIAAPMLFGQKVTNTNVTTIVHDENTAPNDLLTRSDDYNGAPPWQASYGDTGVSPNGKVPYNQGVISGLYGP